MSRPQFRLQVAAAVPPAGREGRRRANAAWQAHGYSHRLRVGRWLVRLPAWV